MKTSSKIIIAVVLTAGITGTVYAVKNHALYGGPGERAEWVVERVSRHLDLNDEQNQKLQYLKSQILALRGEVMQSRAARHAEFRELLTAPVMDQQRIVDLIREKTNEINLRAPSMVAAVAEFTDSLTPEQKTEMGELMAWKFGHHRHH